MLRLILIFAIAFFSSAGISRAENISLDLLEQGCPTEWYYDTPSWQTDFDLGVTFSEISHVYVDWSGEFTGGLLAYVGNPLITQPIDVGLWAGFSDPWRTTHIYGGEENYPDSVAFTYHSEIVLEPSEDWGDILDGAGTFSIAYTIPGPYAAIFRIVEHGSVTLNSAALVIDGVVVPEPTSFLTVSIGVIVVVMSLMGKVIRGRRA